MLQTGPKKLFDSWFNWLIDGSTAGFKQIWLRQMLPDGDHWSYALGQLISYNHLNGLQLQKIDDFQRIRNLEDFDLLLVLV